MGAAIHVVIDVYSTYLVFSGTPLFYSPLLSSWTVKNANYNLLLSAPKLRQGMT